MDQIEEDKTGKRDCNEYEFEIHMLYISESHDNY